MVDIVRSYSVDGGCGSSQTTFRGGYSADRVLIVLFDVPIWTALQLKGIR